MTDIPGPVEGHTAGPWVRVDCETHADIFAQVGGANTHHVAMVARPEDADLIARAPAMAAELALLADPAAVHFNMLRGGIAKPTPSHIGHLYRGEEAVAVVAEVRRQNAEAFAGDEIATLKARVAELEAECDEAVNWSAIVDRHGTDRFDDLAEQWASMEAITRLRNALCSVFTKWANEELMTRFHTQFRAITETAFTEGAICGVRAELAKSLPTITRLEAEKAELVGFVRDTGSVLSDLLSDQPAGTGDPDDDPLVDLLRRALSLLSKLEGGE